MSDWVNAVIEVTIPLDDVAVTDSGWAKQEAVTRAMDELLNALPPRLQECVSMGMWEDASDD